MAVMLTLATLSSVRRTTSELNESKGTPSRSRMSTTVSPSTPTPLISVRPRRIFISPSGAVPFRERFTSGARTSMPSLCSASIIASRFSEFLVVASTAAPYSVGQLAFKNAVMYEM